MKKKTLLFFTTLNPSGKNIGVKLFLICTQINRRWQRTFPKSDITFYEVSLIWQRRTNLPIVSDHQNQKLIQSAFSQLQLYSALINFFQTLWHYVVQYQAHSFAFIELIYESSRQDTAWEPDFSQVPSPLFVVILFVLFLRSKSDGKEPC